ncbi:MAG: lysophospholipase [Gemmatimonadetes bacterium]|nr:lysophospholipase [Gemmatimonadota bacterium]
MTTQLLTRSEGFLEGVRGLRLYYRAWEAPAPSAALLIVHGLGEHSARYVAFAEAMTGNGISCFALDLRGHGCSEGRRGHAARFDVLLQDLDRFRREVMGLIAPELPIFLLGHSMGGLLALRYLEEYGESLRGAILVSPWLATAMPVPRWKTTLAGALNRLLPSLPFAARIRAEHLCRDPHVVQNYKDDPLVHDTITPRLFSEASAAMGLVLQRSERLRVPLLFLLASDDRLVDTQRTATFARSLQPDLVTVRIFPDYYHEVLNEPANDDALDAICDWVARHPA